MTNLYAETVAALEYADKQPADIAFIGSIDGALGCTWAEYTKLADFTYDSGYGGAEVPGDLVVVFRDGSYLERGEYDGSEWWAYKSSPRVPKTYETITNLDRRHGGFWNSVAEVNGAEAIQ